MEYLNDDVGLALTFYSDVRYGGAEYDYGAERALNLQRNVCVAGSRWVRILIAKGPFCI